MLPSVFCLDLVPVNWAPQQLERKLNIVLNNQISFTTPLLFVIHQQIKNKGLEEAWNEVWVCKTNNFLSFAPDSTKAAELSPTTSRTRANPTTLCPVSSVSLANSSSEHGRVLLDDCMLAFLYKNLRNFTEWSQSPHNINSPCFKRTWPFWN